MHYQYTSVWFFAGAILSLGDDLIFRMHFREGYSVPIGQADALRWIGRYSN